MRIEAPTLPDSLLPVEGSAAADAFRIRESASLLWVSNQADDLLCLPYCSIDRHEYQIRTALRVIGSLRGRALLSDEVGLGKTVEAGLVLKEYLVRGMVRRFLILTTPSLVDQWREELESKFSIAAATTNDPGWRNDPGKFWWDNPGVVASLATLRQENHIAEADRVAWDMVVVDEAHHLRNRASKSWEAVNRLPRRFLLLLTATPVQNSLEELYQLITLLQPGQLPPPAEFARRYLDRSNPRRPKETEQLRELLGQVMIRNTRASCGVILPGRRAETALFDAPAGEREEMIGWEECLRAHLSALPRNEAALRGRTVLQAAGSSPAALGEACRDLPDGVRPRAALGQATFRERLDALPPLARAEGGVVVFSQFLATQAAIAVGLEERGVRVRSINGQTPADRRQGIVDAFRAEGGVLLLSRGGSEGRNLQFCHRLVNFDLPWNPMEIEQRIGRLHRLGQTRRVEIYTFVDRGTLQARILDLLQEKLNLFELVVGETGVILGERFSSGDFAEEIFRSWHENDPGILDRLGAGLDVSRASYEETRVLDATLFAEDYVSE